MMPDVLLIQRPYCPVAFIPRQAIHRSHLVGPLVVPEDVEPRIVAAAIKHNGRIYTGKRHAFIMRQIWDEAEQFGLPIPKIAHDEHQGFVDNHGIFWNRFQAGAIAYRAGQTEVRKQELTSEDLW